MTNKVLFVATVDFHFQAFHLPFLKWFKDQGWDVHVAASGRMNLPFVDKKYTIPIQRSPFSKGNLNAFLELKKIITQEHYQIIHCHTPMGGVLGRLAARDARKQGTQVIYTAHGFHFCKGAPLKNWMLYYPIEKILSRSTDCLITINSEDFHLAHKHRFNATLIKHVHGIGVNTEIYKPIEEGQKLLLRKKYGYNKDQFLMFYAAEFNRNKNQKLLINSLSSLKETIPNAKLLLAGEGPLLKECKELALKLGVNSLVDFLGYRTDIECLLKMSDVAVASSLREGLPVNIMEAMASGLPVIGTINRGHSELIFNGINGYIISPKNLKEFPIRILELFNSRQLKNKMGAASINIIKKYSLSKISIELTEIYSKFMVVDSNETKSKYHRAYL